MRVAITLSYDGTHFLGSQSQKSSTNTILGNLEHVLKEINIDSKIIASGRTDKGVHATGQVCSFDFYVKYGELGDDFIEGHHTKPVSEFNDFDGIKNTAVSEFDIEENGNHRICILNCTVHLDGL